MSTPSTAPPAARSRAAGVARRAAGAWHALALLVLNTLVLLAVLNAALAVWFPAPPAAPTPVTITPEVRARFDRVFLEQGHDAKYQPFFPHWPRERIAALNTDTFTVLKLEYEPFAEFRHAALTSRFVNVDPHGFRRGWRQGPWPPDPRALNVFVFGGSTTLGVMLPDAFTVPSQLQRLLPRALGRERPIRVYNFGRGYFFSSQERALFASLLVAGRRPDVAIFLDGLNEFYFAADGAPAMTATLQACMARGDEAGTSPLARLARSTALGRAAAWTAERLGGPPATATAPSPPLPFADESGGPAERVIRRYAENARLMDADGAATGVRVVRAWQPVPTYAYDLRHHRFAQDGFGHIAATTAGYPAVAQAHAEGRLGPPGLVWCADMQRTLAEPLYVDTVHYAPRMARRVAACIVKAMRRSS